MARGFASASSEYLNVTSTPITAAPITMACWFRPTDTSHEGGLISIPDTASNTSYFFLAMDGGGGILYGQVRAGSIIDAITSTGPSANTWHHGCFAVDGSGNLKIFIDGGSKGTDTGGGTPTGLNGYGIGANYKFSTSLFFNGRISEVGIWNVFLDDTEVVSLANGAAPPLVRSSSLVSYVPLVRDEDEDRVAGLSFTANATPTIEDHPRVFYGYRSLLGLAAAAAPPAGTNPKGPLGHPLHGPFGGPV